MSRLPLFRLVLACCTVGLATGEPPQASAALSKRQLQKVESQVLPAYYRGNTAAVLESLSQLTRRMSDKQVAELDEVLARQDVPPAGELLVRARLSLLRQNARRLPKPAVREVLITLAHIHRQLEGLLAESAGHAIMGKSLPEVAAMSDYEAILWDTHVLEQRLQTATGLAQYAAALVDDSTRIRKDALEPEQLKLLETDFSTFVTRLKESHRTLANREIDLRVQRLNQAKDILANSQDHKSRFLAAWAIDVDGDLLLKEGVEDVREVVNTGRELAGELLEKSRLLYTGLHWWFRGRYGKGTDGFGFLKPGAAVNSPAAQFALYMPTVKPKPTDPRDPSAYRVPEVDRRHHYVWAWEYRRVSSSSDSSSETSSTTRQTGKETKLSRFY